MVHLENIDLREREEKILGGIDAIRQRFMLLDKTSIALTILHGEKVLGVIGVLNMWPGVGEVWVVPSKHIEKHGLMFAKKVKKQLELLEEVHNYHRLQVIAVQDKLHNRWLSWLGFCPEGIMRRYSAQKEDYGMWARVKTWE